MAVVVSNARRGTALGENGSEHVCVSGLKEEREEMGMVGGKSPEVLNKEPIRAPQVHKIL